MISSDFYQRLRRCFVVFDAGIIMLFNVNSGCIPCLRVKAKSHDLLSFILT